ncbi:MAG: hypothetical protein WCD35_12115 [Mycobacteriales bacterium]
MTLSKIAVRLQARALAARSDRGDIPGWVLITIMTAGLVTLVWGVANQQLKDILTNALNSVRSP